MIRLLILLAAAYFVWCFALTAFQEKLIFPGTFLRRDGDSRPRPADALQLWREVDGVGRVEAWFIPGRGCTATNPGPLVVYAHGNGELIDDHPPGLSFYTAAGVSLLLPEYRGYGRSAGTPGEAALVGDCGWFLEQILQRPEVDRERVIYHGRSIGGGVVARLAAQRPPAALILESSFSSLAAMTARYLAPAALLRHPFRTDEVVRTLDRPILILHGTRDASIGVSHSRYLAGLNTRAKLVEFDAGHNDFPPDPAAYVRCLMAFLADTGVVNAGK